MSDDNEMDKAKERVGELGLPEQFDELEDSEKVADELFWQLVEYDLPPKTELYAAMNIVARVLNCALDEEKQTLCDEARSDLDEIIKAILTPDSVFEARARRSKFKIVRGEDAS